MSATGLASGLLVLMAFVLFRKNADKNLLTEAQLELRKANRAQTLPLRLSAYERCILFLERSSPQNLIPRLDTANKTARQYQLQLVNDIRAEFEHNLSQQLYVSEEAWAQIIRSREDVISLIHRSTSLIGDNAPAIELAKKILEDCGKLPQHPAENALRTLKKEVRQLF